MSKQDHGSHYSDMGKPGDSKFNTRYNKSCLEQSGDLTKSLSYLLVICEQKTRFRKNLELCIQYK